MRGLFREPERLPHQLSHMYAKPAYFDGKIRWTTYKTQADCDECFAIQHENPDTLSRARAKATQKRTTDYTTLLLCGPHAELWKKRDAE